MVSFYLMVVSFVGLMCTQVYGHYYPNQWGWFPSNRRKPDSTPPAKKACGLVPADIVFVLDSSGSVGFSNFKRMLKFVEDVVKDFEVKPTKTQIGVITFNSNPRLEFHLNTFSSKASTIQGITRITYSAGKTETYKALKYVREYMFKSGNGGRKSVAKIVIVITDGNSADRKKTEREATNLKKIGITVFALGVGGGININELNDIASDPIDQHVFTVKNFGALRKIKDKLAEKSCEVPISSTDYCKGVICQNGGSCVEGLSTYTCNCTASHTGQHCEKDIDFCEGVTCQNGGSCVDGFSTYTCNCPASHTGQHCETDIDFCESVICQNGGDCVDGLSTYICNCSSSHTGKHCETDIDFCEGVTCQNGGSCVDDLSTYTCNCPASHTGQHCETDIDFCEGVTCQNGGSCVDGLSTYTCNCPASHTGQHCETAQTSPPANGCGIVPADIVFVLDSSGSVGYFNLKKVLVFVQEVVKNFKIDKNSTRIGAVTFSDKPHLEFYLNEFSTKEATIERISKISYVTGNTFTGDALQYVREKMFISSKGARKSAAKIVIVITDGQSSNREKTTQEATKLKDEGITIFAIGIGSSTYKSELNTMATDPDDQHVFSVKNFNALSGLKDKLAKKSCEVPTSTSAPTKGIVGFHVQLSTDKTSSTTVTFDTVITNVGNGYSTSTGQFVAPTEGLYFFTVSFLGKCSTGLKLNIVYNDKVVARAWAMTNPGNNDNAATTSAVLFLQKDDVVQVVRPDIKQQLYTGQWTSFSGYLVSSTQFCTCN